MAQYGTALEPVVKAGSVASVRKPTFSVYVDLVGDVSEDIEQFDLSTLTEDSLREPNYGRGTIILNNEGGKYTDSDLSLIEEDSLVRVFVGFENENILIWTGIVTDAQPSGSSDQMGLSVAQLGERFRNRSTSGDFGDYPNPKALYDFLAASALLPAPIIQNEAAYPSDFTFGNTDIDANTTYWSLIHGASLTINVIPFFDENGVLNTVLRNTVNDVDLFVDDSVLIDLQYIQDGELINQKTIDYGTSVKWGEPTLGDIVHPWQQSITKSDAYSKARWGTHANYETDPFIGSFPNAKGIAFEILDWFAFRRAKYVLRMPGIPYLQLFDRFSISSDRFNVQGKFTIIGRTHHFTRGVYITDDLIISHGERL